MKSLFFIIISLIVFSNVNVNAQTKISTKKGADIITINNLPAPEGYVVTDQTTKDGKFICLKVYYFDNLPLPEGYKIISFKRTKNGFMATKRQIESVVCPLGTTLSTDKWECIEVKPEYLPKSYPVIYN